MALISLDGNIGAGKTTLLKKLKDIPNVKIIEEPVNMWEQFHVDNKNILEHFYGDTRRWAYTFQNAAMLTRILHVQKTIKENPGFDYYITERSVLTDKNVFAKMLHKEKQIDDMEMQLYNMWFDTFGKTETISGIMWLTTDVSTCVDRIKMRGRSGEENISREYLDKLHQTHHEWLNNEIIPVYAIDCNMSANDLYSAIKSMVPVKPV
jgi:deoxyadenosine/deoxycytidine kinase